MDEYKNIPNFQCEEITTIPAQKTLSLNLHLNPMPPIKKTNIKSFLNINSYYINFNSIMYQVYCKNNLKLVLEDREILLATINIINEKLLEVIDDLPFNFRFIIEKVCFYLTSNFLPEDWNLPIFINPNLCNMLFSINGRKWYLQFVNIFTIYPELFNFLVSDECAEMIFANVNDYI